MASLQKSACCRAGATEQLHKSRRLLGKQSAHLMSDFPLANRRSLKPSTGQLEEVRTGRKSFTVLSRSKDAEVTTLLEDSNSMNAAQSSPHRNHILIVAVIIIVVFAVVVFDILDVITMVATTTIITIVLSPSLNR